MNIRDNQVDLNKIKNTAEKYYGRGDIYASEAIIKVIKDEFDFEISKEGTTINLGFPVGMGGVDCTCGAVSGGMMAISMVFGRNESENIEINKTMDLCKELQHIFKEKSNSICLRLVTKGDDIESSEYMKQCTIFTGEVAEETAIIIARELSIKTI